MTSDVLASLDAAVAAKAESDLLRRRRSALAERITEAEGNVIAARLQLQGEERAVKRLERVSFAHLVSSLRGTHASDLSKEKAEAERARYRINAAREELGRLLREEQSVKSQLEALGDPEAAYEKALAAVVEAGRNDSAVAARAESATRELVRLRECRGIDEALESGEVAQEALARARDSLSAVQDWSMWDTFAGGGMVSSVVKHDALDKTVAHLRVAASACERFSRDLDDVGIPEVDGAVVSQFDRAVDIWFDNIFTDLSVHQSVNEATDDIRRAEKAVSTAMDGLLARRATLSA
ncbi:hypothetical protein [Dermatophilus congolensis]|uniref:Uncharacterized protein n=1 Tax=Dermatophilus congolensis TaxID=1863 RepID=A0A239VJ49_9MICO|nr:hypothetical protein [Dermatophilus congolensis]MBO3129194.1 hypothetical protein [Dermatophilus congolensis]MBO3132172.1 hypothetical protein [Dermatophilus congolensis]MBO3133672.1 hypothetical protein [Dermatophilus congolensis]MBO3135905.1 hypothetical protein [Dermatophilus congolensis]MBO3138144.1 hypothetical protein [Dermatophilus congolensis]